MNIPLHKLVFGVMSGICGLTKLLRSVSTASVSASVPRCSAASVRAASNSSRGVVLCTRHNSIRAFQSLSSSSDLIW